MARVIAFIPDLLFGSNVIGALRVGGHDPVLASDSEAVGRELPGADVVIVDLTYEPEQRIEQARAWLGTGARSLAFYAHVEPEVRARAEEAGFDLVVPRSRMAREGPSLVDRLSAGA